MTIKDLTDSLAKHPSKRYNKRYLERIKSIALHHSGAATGSPQSFATYHVSQGWPGIGYHYVIDKEGNIYQTNRLDTISYNVGPLNGEVVGICVIGNYDKETLNEAQKTSIIDTVNLIRLIVGHKPVKGHKEYKSTDCPGKNIIEFIKNLNNG